MISRQDSATTISYQRISVSCSARTRLRSSDPGGSRRSSGRCGIQENRDGARVRLGAMPLIPKLLKLCE